MKFLLKLAFNQLNTSAVYLKSTLEQALNNLDILNSETFQVEFYIPPDISITHKSFFIISNYIHGNTIIVFVYLLNSLSIFIPYSFP